MAPVESLAVTLVLEADEALYINPAAYISNRYLVPGQVFGTEAQEALNDCLLLSETRAKHVAQQIALRPFSVPAYYSCGLKEIHMMQKGPHWCHRGSLQHKDNFMPEQGTIKLLKLMTYRNSHGMLAF